MSHICKRIFKFELQLSGYWQNIKFSRYYPKFHIFHKNRNFSSIFAFLDQLLHPYKFYGRVRDMSGILFLHFSHEPLISYIRNAGDSVWLMGERFVMRFYAWQERGRKSVHVGHTFSIREGWQLQTWFCCAECVTMVTVRVFYPISNQAVFVTYLTKGGWCCNPNRFDKNLMMLNLVPIYRSWSFLPILTKIRTINLSVTSLRRHIRQNGKR